MTQRRFVLQDTTTRVWDVRMTGRGSLAVLKGRIGAIRSLRYSPCGRVLAVAEPADFITLYDASEGYEQAQEVSPSVKSLRILRGRLAQAGAGRWRHAF